MAVEPKMPNVIRLDSDELPDIKNWRPGQRYRIVLDVEQVTSSTGTGAYGDPNAKNTPDMSASFRVLSAKPQYGGGPVKQAPTTSGKPDKSDTMDVLKQKAAQ